MARVEESNANIRRRQRRSGSPGLASIVRRVDRRRRPVLHHDGAVNCGEKIGRIEERTALIAAGWRRERLVVPGTAGVVRDPERRTGAGARPADPSRRDIEKKGAAKIAGPQAFRRRWANFRKL